MTQWRAAALAAILAASAVLLAGTAPTAAEPVWDPREEATARLRMVQEQLAASLDGRQPIADPRVLEAMRTVPRHRFVPHALRGAAYADTPLPIGEGQTISQPYIVALMTELADVQPQERVLEVGTGSGYQAAVLSVLAAQVYTIEILPALAQRAEQTLQELGVANVHVRAGDGYLGWSEAAPFDAILVTAAAPRIPEPLIEQLAPGGKLVIPVGDWYQELEVLIKTSTGLEHQRSIPVRFVPMTGEIRDPQEVRK